MGPPELVAVVSLGAAWDAACQRCAQAGKRIVAPWRFANLNKKPGSRLLQNGTAGLGGEAQNSISVRESAKVGR